MSCRSIVGAAVDQELVGRQWLYPHAPVADRPPHDDVVQLRDRRGVRSGARLVLWRGHRRGTWERGTRERRIRVFVLLDDLDAGIAGEERELAIGQTLIG